MNAAPPNEPETERQPVDPELVAELEQLLANIETTTTWDLATYMNRARTYLDLVLDVDRLFDIADTYGEELEPESVEDVLETIDILTERLRDAEQDEALAAETIAAARAETAVEPDDERTITLGVRVNPISFRRQQPNMLPLLLRQLVGGHFDGNYRLITGPAWLPRWIEQQGRFSSVWAVEIVEDVPTGEILEVANTLWDPQQDGAYQTPVAVLEAARLLDA